MDKTPEGRAEHDRQLEEAMKIQDPETAALTISRITGMGLEDSAIMWAVETGRSPRGDIVGGFGDAGEED